tara:strand:+ start:47 stop:214 length:168 start_codon:yes stop_codon:yes gene_type:complete
MYIPVFKDKLARLENRGLGSGEEAQKLRNTIAFVQMEASPAGAEKVERRFLATAE